MRSNLHIKSDILSHSGGKHSRATRHDLTGSKQTKGA